MSDGFFAMREIALEQRRNPRAEEKITLPPLLERVGAFASLGDLQKTLEVWKKDNHPDALTLDAIRAELSDLFVSAGRDPNDPELWNPVYLDYVSRGKFDGHGALGRIFAESKAAEAMRHQQRVAEMFTETLGNARTDATIRKLFGE